MKDEMQSLSFLFFL